MQIQHLPGAPGLLVRIVMAAGLLLLAAGCGAPEAPEVGRAAPAYQASTLEGDPVSLASLRGEVVLVNLWATWCYPCRREMPSLDVLQREFGEAGLRVVAVSIDGAGDADAIREFVEEYRLGLTVLHDPGQRFARTYQTRGVPETFLIGADGVLLRHWIGRIDGHSPAVRAVVQDALAARASHVG